MKRDDIGGVEQLTERRRGPRVAQRQPRHDVVIDDVQAHRLGHHRDLCADVAVTDDTEHAATYLVRVVGRLVPPSGVHVHALVAEVPVEADDLGDRQLGDAACVRERAVEHGDTAAACRAEVDLVGADAEAADREEVGHALERFFGDL